VTDRERFEAAAASCGLRVVRTGSFEDIRSELRGEVTAATLDEGTGEVEYAEDPGVREQVECMRRTLASEPE